MGLSKLISSSQSWDTATSSRNNHHLEELSWHKQKHVSGSLQQWMMMIIAVVAFSFHQGKIQKSKDGWLSERWWGWWLSRGREWEDNKWIFGWVKLRLTSHGAHWEGRNAFLSSAKSYFGFVIKSDYTLAPPTNGTKVGNCQIKVLRKH